MFIAFWGGTKKKKERKGKKREKKEKKRGKEREKEGGNRKGKWIWREGHNSEAD